MGQDVLPVVLWVVSTIGSLITTLALGLGSSVKVYTSTVIRDWQVAQGNCFWQDSGSIYSWKKEIFVRVLDAQDDQGFNRK